MADDGQQSRLTPLVASQLQLSTPPSPPSTRQDTSQSTNRPAKKDLDRPQRCLERSRRRTPRAIFHADEFVAVAQNVALSDPKMAQMHQNAAQTSSDLSTSSGPDRKRAAAGVELSPRSTLSQDNKTNKKSKRGLLVAAQVEVVEVEAKCHKSQTVLKRAMSIQTVVTSGSLSLAPVVPPRLLRHHASEQSISVTSASAPPPLPVLPTVYSSRHPDLNVITPQTVAKVLRGTFQEQLEGFELLDCRFPFEFEGGTLTGACSLCDPERMEAQFFASTALENCARTALIFFCEFSANRAPKMLRHVRNVDRRLHAESYPDLYYPELYLIDGGYRNCFETLQHEICAPSALYVQMDDERFVEACRQEFASWRRRWKPHKVVANCAAKLEKSPRRSVHKHHQVRAAGVRSLFGEV